MGVATWGRRFTGAWQNPMLSIGLGMGLSVTGSPVLAQVIPDTSLGSQVNGAVTGCDGTGLCSITGGTAAGGNLFHSFSEFSLSGANAEARFLVEPTVDSIFTRVTGGQLSNIDGLLSVPNSTADLFLMNPAGITFGANARLNLQGSFAATTATGVEFENGSSFDLATNQADAGLLSVESSAFLYSQIPQPIAVQPGAILSVAESSPNGIEPEALILSGGDINLSGGTLRAPGGGVLLTGLSTPGAITLTEDNFEFSDGAERSDINLAAGAIVDVVAGDRGNILFFGKNINISGADTNLCAGIGPGSSCGQTGSATQGGSQAGNVFLNATGAVSIREARIENNLNPGSTGNQDNIFEAISSGDTERFFGSILISANAVELDSNAALSVSTFGQGSAGIVSVEALQSITVNESDIFSNVTSDAVGDAGGILLQAPQIQILGESTTIASDIFGLAQTDEQGRVSLIGDDILLEAGEVSTEVLRAGNAGLIRLTGANSVRVINGGRVTSSLGSVNDDNSQISVVGDAGDIAIAAGRLIEIDDNSAIVSNINPGALGVNFDVQDQTLEIGGAGNIFLSAPEIRITNNSEASTTAFGQGAAGGVLVDSSGDLILENQGKIFANAQDQATSGGAILIFADRLIARDRSGLTSSNFTSGNAQIIDTSAIQNGSSTGEGGATIVSSRRIILDDKSFIGAVSTSGEGGGILLFTREYTALNDDSFITTSSFETEDNRFLNDTGELVGSGGDILSFTQFLSSTPRQDSDLTATAVDGKGGFIFVDAFTLFNIAERPLNSSSNDISAESGAGINGTVSVNALDIDPSRSLDDLPENRLPELLAEGCRPTGRPAPKNKFYSTGLGGLPPNPSDILRGSTVLANLEEDSPDVAASESSIAAYSNSSVETTVHDSKEVTAIAPPSQPIIAARGWLRDDNGDVFFSASAPNLTAQTGPKPYSSCSAAS